MTPSSIDDSVGAPLLGTFVRFINIKVNMATNLSFKPKQITKKLLSVLPERAQDIIVKRYGLGKSTERMTLEAIGKEYGITRERVRQIEEYSLGNIRKSDAFEEIVDIFVELSNIVDEMGAVVSEQELLDTISSSAAMQNNIHFLLVLGNPFTRLKENDNFTHQWTINTDLADQVHTALHDLHDSLHSDDIISESELLDSFISRLKNVSDKYKEEETLRRWLGISKKIGQNPLGEWGRADSSNINVKGMRDYAFLVIRRHGSPIHFREVADTITKLFGKKAHVATTHNELIKDPRFVLVGRGLYALSEWGYASGVVREVISNILKKHGPLTKSEIIDKVLKERYVKENTIMVNLQNPKYFNKDSKGRYTPTK